jgi:hypothetical protein
MNIPQNVTCPKCGRAHEQSAPFCPECGELSPFVVGSGNLSVVLREVPSENLRDHVIATLKVWFPGIDSLEADRRLKNGYSVLISGINEESARRIITALKGTKVVAKLERDPSWVLSLWNMGLIVSAISGLLAIGSGVIGAIVWGLTALGAPVVGALIKLRKLSPVARAPMSPERAEKWIEIANRYRPVMLALDGEPAVVLKNITETVMDLERRLSNHSLVARVAGEHSGSLFHLLEDALHTAIEIGRRISKEKPENRQARQQELESLGELVEKTGEWYRRLEVEGVGESPALTQEFDEITESIDRIINEVRSVDRGSRLTEGIYFP